MEKNDVIASLLELPEFEPDRKTVKLPRLNLVLELQEVPYNKLVRIRREEDAQLHLILAAVVNHPELRQAEWYHDKEGCATPVDALKSCCAWARWRSCAGSSISSTATGRGA